MNSIVYGNISKVLSEITTDISNNIGKHNTFVVVTNSEEHYPERVDPVILRFDQNQNEWLLVADKTILDFGYVKETIDIIDNDVFLSHIPLDEIIWDVYIIDENNNIVKTIIPKEVLVSGNLISGLKEYIGKTLSLMYSFGKVNGTNTIIKHDNPNSGGYYNQVVDTMVYDGPYDMNDILTDIVFPDTNSYFDKVILKRIEEMSDAIELINSRKLYVTDRILIANNKIRLPYKPIGSIVHNMANVYMTNNNEDKTIVFEVTCIVIDNDVTFDELDEINGYYAEVTYLAEIGSPTI